MAANGVTTRARVEATSPEVAVAANPETRTRAEPKATRRAAMTEGTLCLKNFTLTSVNTFIYLFEDGSNNA